MEARVTCLQLARIPRICRKRTCTTFTANPSGRCDEHQTEQRRAYHEQTAYYHTTEWRHLRAACLTRDHDQCVCCTSKHRLTAHHIHARAEGGADTLLNLVTMCGHCHSQLEAGSTHVRGTLKRQLEAVGAPHTGVVREGP